MVIPVENVGSLPRSIQLQSAFEDYNARKISLGQLRVVQHEACRDTIKRMEETGQPIVSDGEQRASSFATYPIMHSLAGGLANTLAEGGQYFAFFEDGHHRQLPRLVSGPFRYQTYAAEFVKESLPLSNKPIKQAVISPSMLYLLYPLEEDLPNYPREQFEADLVNECEKDIRQCFAAGATRVSIDFTEGRLSLKDDPRNPWTRRALLEKFIELNNRVLARFSTKERVNIGLHTCPGGKTATSPQDTSLNFTAGDCDSVHSSEVNYAEFLPSLFKINAGYFLIQASSEDDKERVYKLCGQHSRENAEGVAQVCFIGVTSTINPKVETPQEICEALLLAAKYIPVERLGATDDCGFSPFSIDKKPKHSRDNTGGDPDYAREIAFQKIKARVDGAHLASQKLGMV